MLLLLLLLLQYEGILVQDTYEAHVEAWKKVSQEFDLPRPLGHTFRWVLFDLHWLLGHTLGGCCLTCTGY